MSDHRTRRMAAEKMRGARNKATSHLPLASDYCIMLLARDVRRACRHLHNFGYTHPANPAEYRDFYLTYKNSAGSCKTARSRFAELQPLCPSNLQSPYKYNYNIFHSAIIYLQYYSKK